jgi:hypothetical protein
VLVLAALIFSGAAAAGVDQDLPVFKRARHPYDTLPKSAASVSAGAKATRRVATALDLANRAYFVYAALMRDGRTCVVLVQSTGYTSSCAPNQLFFEKGRRTATLKKGLVGGVAAKDVTKIVLQGAGKRKTVELTKDHGFLFGCPAPSKCAAWVQTVLGYDKAGKLVSRERVA